MTFDSTLEFTGDLSAVVIRKDGSIEDLGTISSAPIDTLSANKKLRSQEGLWRRVFGNELGLVTTTGINLLAADFVSGASTHIAAFNYHDFGTGVTAAVIADTALQTPAGTSRSSGTQSTPVAGQYRSVGTVTFTSTLAITEWGLFSAATTGTMWDHRVFSAINVNSGDAIALTYTLTTTAGGS